MIYIIFEQNRYYIYALIVVVLIIIYATIKYKYGFWIHQPVYHVYDISYYFLSNKIIDNELPVTNKYVNVNNINTKINVDMTEIDWINFINFIQKYFLRNDGNVYNPKLDNVVPFFKNSVNSLISIYYENIIYRSLDTANDISDKSIVGVITSRPIYVIIKNIPIQVYYVDYLCVNTNKRKKGIASELIQTHHYNQRRLNKNIKVSLFKRDQELNWIVPLTYYDTNVYDMTKYNHEIILHSKYKIIEGSSTNMVVIMDFIKKYSGTFDLFIYDNYSTFLDTINTQNVYIYLLLNIELNEIMALYAFKKTCVTIDKSEIITCTGSINNTNVNIFYYAFIKITQMFIIKYPLISIENLSNNNILIKQLTISPILISPTAYFLYNYIASPIPSNKCLILI
jgi:hypothetical protein